jgi:hypothetical protein
MDMETFDAHPDPVKFWVKETKHDPSEVSNGPYILELFELDCSARRIRRAKTLLYDDTGSIVGGHAGRAWDNIAPQSVGEMFFDGVCRHS